MFGFYLVAFGRSVKYLLCTVLSEPQEIASIQWYTKMESPLWREVIEE